MLAAPLPLAFSRDFLNFVSPPRGAAPVQNADDFCGNSYSNKMQLYEMAASQQHHGLQRTLFFIGLMGFGLFAISMFLRAHTTVVIDRGARVLRVSTPNDHWSAAFGERPTLVEQGGAYLIYARDLAPVVIARRGAPRVAIDRLRAALERLRESF